MPAPELRGTASDDPIDLAVLGLDDLAYLPAAELDALYARGKNPRISDLEGPTRGIFLATPRDPERLLKLLARVRRSRLALWRGKTFAGVRGGEGEGYNRLLSDARPWIVCPFYTRVITSRVGAFQAIELDYNHPKNPRVFRGMRDELRQLNERVYLGRWYMRVLGRELFVGFFGLERRPN
jgi:hypothetical protein